MLTRYRLALGALLFGAAAYAAAGVRGWEGTGWSLGIGTFLMIACPFAGGVLAVWAALRLSGRARTSWLLLGTGACAWAGGQAAYAYYELVRGTDPPLPGPPDVGFLCAVVLIAIGALRYPAVPRRRWSVVRSGLDAAMVTISMLLLGWVTLIRGVYEAGDVSIPERMVTLAYPVGDVLVISVLLLTLRRTPIGGRVTLGLLLVGLLLLVTGDTGYLLFTANDTYYTGHPIDVGWWAGLLLVGLAALTYRDEAVPEDGSPLRRRAIFIPYASTVIALVVVAIDWLVLGQWHPFEIALAACLVALLLVRQSVVALDSVSLTAQVRSRENELAYHAYHDPLTGLPNLRSLRNHLDAIMARGGRAEAVVFVDLDGFKSVNDTLGHDAGDELLCHTAERLRGSVRDDDVVARLGGDEFAVVLAVGADARTAGERLVERIRFPFWVSGTRVPLTASAGIAPWTSGRTGEELLRNADLAMYRAKDSGRNQARLYEPVLHVNARRRLDLEIALRNALEAEEFRVVYQPIVRLDSSEPIGVEALLRWDRGGTLVSPMEFVAVAEESGLIAPLGRWVLDRACADLAAWRGHGCTDLTLAVNIAAVQLADRDFPWLVRDILDRRGIPVHRLVLEVTERVLLDENTQPITSLQDLRDLGVALSLDDFGTGYASLSSLRILPAQSLKIDRSFVAEITNGTLGLITGIAALAEQLHLPVIAEGVETSEQRDLLCRTGISYGQGYLFARPMVADDVPDFVDRSAGVWATPVR